MKKIAWRKVFAVLFGLILVGYTTWAVVRTQSIDKTLLCKSIEVEISDSVALQFVTRSAVVSIIKNSAIPVINKPLYDIPLVELQKLLASKSYIKKVTVFVTGDGLLHVQLEQRQPIIRIAPDDKTAFYIDAKGFVFPLSATFTYKVPIVTGNITLPFDSKVFKGALPAKKTELLRQLMGFSEYIQSHPFWNAQITQIIIDSKNQIVLNTCTGDFDILLGSVDQYEYKLQKLYSFYQKALPVEGWGKYRKLDIRFNKQVVATLK